MQWQIKWLPQIRAADSRFFLVLSLLLTGLMPPSILAPIAAEGATASPAAVDLLAYPALEVTQGVQTYKPAGNVPLIGRKRTVVFFYARVNEDSTQVSYAELTAERDSKKQKLLPLNAGGYAKLTGKLPNRYTGSQQFRFELPAFYTEGTVTLTAVLNPDKTHPVESNYDNNVGSKTITFEYPYPLSLAIYDVRYKLYGFGDRVFSVTDLEVDGVRNQRGQMVDWLRSAYPLNKVNWKKSSVYMGKKIKYPSGNINMLCTTVNGAVLWGINHDSNSPGPNFHGYGMTSASGAYMRGCAELASKRVASGPTYIFNGDPATSGGDDYGGHELGHIFGREHPHPAVCGEGLIDSGPYPYPKGSISPIKDAFVNMAQEWGTAVLGVDISRGLVNPAIYTAEAADMMTYCKPRWPSDFSYKAMLGYFKTQFGPGQIALAAAPSAKMDRFILQGVVDNLTNAVLLEPIFVVANEEEAPGHATGNYAIVLRDGAGTEVSRYPFSPSAPVEAEPGDALEAQTGVDPASETPLISQPRFINEYVPFLATAARIDIEGPGGVLLHSVTAGAAAPTVNLIAPNGGNRITPDVKELEASWSGSDPDGDEIFYAVEYSADNGQSWMRYTSGITETNVLLPEDLLVAGNQVLVRVLASDGIHSTSDTSDATFAILNHPPTIALVNISDNAITQPFATYAQGQTLALGATAYDNDEGSLDDAITWSSSIDGPLQTGALLSHAALSVGVHTLSAKVQDRQGITAAVQSTVTIVATLDDLPPVANQLIAIPNEIRLSNLLEITGTTVLVENLNGKESLAWNATIDQPWVTLDKTTGSTGDTFLVTRASNAPFVEGEQTATITLTSPQLSGVTVTIPVVDQVILREVYLPLVVR